MTKLYGWVGATLLILSGCASTPPPLPAPEPAVLKGQVTVMRNAGIQMLEQGDRLTMIIPTDAFFDPGTTTVKESQQKSLQQMALFTKNFAGSYPNSIIRVTGYTDQVMSQKTQLELSQNYASAVSAYLFNAGIEPRRIATEGRGSREPIADQSNARSASMNRRVVIQVN
jgi:outer membrane protein OmpA-like peptidoglycan-associated protein